LGSLLKILKNVIKNCFSFSSTLGNFNHYFHL
jgi:hypothetical protein